MSDALRNLIQDTQDRFLREPDAAKAVFSSRSSLQDGLRSEAELRGHKLTVDEPESLGGKDTGPNPVELVLAALGTCQEITYRAYATALRIPLEEISVELDGEIDLRGFLAVDEAVRPGYEAVRGTVKIKSSAPPEDIARLRDVVNAHCPVLDILTNPVPVDLALETISTKAAA